MKKRDSTALNSAIAEQWPAAAIGLSTVGVKAAFPHGILAQGSEAAGCEFNATIGQVTDGAGQPLPLPCLTELATPLDPKTAFLYSPQAGQRALREAWRERQRRKGGVSSEHHSSLPVVTVGITQALSVAATLFADEETAVIFPSPYWGNYDLIFRHNSRSRIHTFPCVKGGGFNLDGLDEALTSVGDKKALLILNFPSNPIGYTPSAAMANAIVERLNQHRGNLVVIVDDAYQGMVWEPDASIHSIYWLLAQTADPNRLFPIKADGVTKELLFFPARIGFLTHPLHGAAEAALTSKIKMVERATTGSASGPSQALSLAALNNPNLESEVEAKLSILRARYLALKRAVSQLSNPLLIPRPFNSGCFALIEIDARVNADHLRSHLLSKYGVGTINPSGTNALRLAYCSTREADQSEIVARLDAAATDLGV